jgi:hypothetical protein
MIDVTNLAQHIATLEPGKNAARLAFYNYLVNLCDPRQTITSQLLNSFYARALTFTHWQENRAELFEQTQYCLLSFAKANEASADSVFSELQKSWQADDIETVSIKNQANLFGVVKQYLDKQLTTSEQSRVISDKNGNALAIILNQAKSHLRVCSFPPIAKLVKGELSPVTSEFSLHYTVELNLTPKTFQQIDVGAHTFARFFIDDEGCKGSLIRGYTFQRLAVMDGGSLHKYPMVFYALKRLEQFFIDRNTDPMYQELTQLLERATELLSQGHPEAEKFARHAYERGQLALEQIFPDDKLVQLLITNLEKTLELKAEQTGDPKWEKIRPLDL